MVVFQRTGKDVGWVEGRDRHWHELMQNASTNHSAAEMQAEDPLFILYTSGSTGKPKGVLHTTGAIWFTPPRPLNLSLIIIRMMFTGVRRTWAGSPATAICSMVPGLWGHNADV